MSCHFRVECCVAALWCAGGTLFLRRRTYLGDGGYHSFAIDLVACSIRGVGDQGCDHILQYTSRHRKRIRQLRAPSLLDSSVLVPLLLLPAPRQAGRDCSALCVLFSYSLLCALVCGRRWQSSVFRSMILLYYFRVISAIAAA